MKVPFVKMQGCGNDYIYVDCFENTVENPERVSEILSDRHFGIGGDGLVLICPSQVADAKMRMFNADGSEGLMCGNAIRCVGRFLYNRRNVKKEFIDIETLSGIKRLKINDDNGQLFISVNMGKAEFEPSKIPVKLDGDEIIDRCAEFNGREYKITCVSMGNPHCVVFGDGIDSLEIEKVGPKFENSPLFPERINTEFIEVIDRKTLKMRVWERGSGETLACGTGACAAVSAAVKNGFCDKDTEVCVHLIGGDLYVIYSDEHVTLKGGAKEVFEGMVEI